MKLKTNFEMVVSGHKEATKAGIKILKNGGNAMDAAIATAATLAVAIPNMNGLGGDSIALWYDSKKNKITVINGSGKSPLKASKKYFNSRGIKKNSTKRSAINICSRSCARMGNGVEKVWKKKFKNDIGKRNQFSRKRNRYRSIFKKFF